MASIRYSGGWMPVLLALVLLPAETHALQDPTRPNGFRAPQAESAQQRSFDLASIIIGADRKIAVINGQARRVGQTFEGVRLRQIYPDRVELVDQGRVRILRLDTLPQVRSSQ
jgi:MSHA biogenesis protein MshK